MLLEPAPGKLVASTARQYQTLRHAIRQVMEALPPEQRQSAVIRTPTRLLFSAEIETLFEKFQRESVCS